MCCQKVSDLSGVTPGTSESYYILKYGSRISLKAEIGIIVVDGSLRTGEKQIQKKNSSYLKAA